MVKNSITYVKSVGQWGYDITDKPSLQWATRQYHWQTAIVGQRKYVILDPDETEAKRRLSKLTSRASQYLRIRPRNPEKETWFK